MPRIGIILANHYRQSILEICFAGIDRLRWDCVEDIPVVCVGEEDDRTLDLCKHFDIQHIFHPNVPLTGKYNRACQELIGTVDAVMVLGSDDLISSKTFMRIYEKIEEGYDLVGADDVYFVGLDDTYSSCLVYFGNTTVLGVGRTVSSRVLDKVDWTPWGQPKDRGIDRVMLDTVRSHVEKQILLSDCHIFDLKSAQNLNRIESWVRSRGYSNDLSLLWNNIGDKEISLIRHYIEK